jgi:hypothetical protein
MKTKRVNTGHYEVTVGSRSFEVQKFPDGSWMLFEMNGASRDYIQDYCTKADAVKGLVELLSA